MFAIDYDGIQTVLHVAALIARLAITMCPRVRHAGHFSDQFGLCAIPLELAPVITPGITGLLVSEQHLTPDRAVVAKRDCLSI